MNILSNPLRVIFFFYLFYIYYGYARVPSGESYVQQAANVISDNTIHFISFFILGALAQLANNKSNEFLFGISLSLITSVFIEFIHYVLPFRTFSILEGIFNVLGCVSAIYLISYLRKKNG